MPVAFRNDRVRLLILLKRRGGISEEEFSRQWRAYGDVFSSLASVKSRVMRYEQIHANKEYSRMPSQMGLASPGWDGIVIIDGPDYESLSEVFQSEDYQTVGIPNEESFIDRASCQMLPVDLASLIE